MRLLHNIGTFHHSNYNTREHVAACQEQLSFDGIYLNVWENRDLLLNRKEKTILFVMGNYIGEDNKFDMHNGLPFERYCNWYQLLTLERSYNCELAWHTYSHQDLTKLTDQEVLDEITPPFPMRFLAYPYGAVNERVASLAASVGYEAAYSVNQGNGSPFQLNRRYL